MNKIKVFLIIWMVLFISACATKIKPDELSAVKTVGVLNHFPEKPNFVTIGTTIFNNDYSSVNDIQFFNNLNETVVNYLVSKGFKAQVIKEHQRNDFDMVIELIPRDVYAMPGTFGVGVNQRSMFGNAMQANTYVALNIEPHIMGKSKCSACYLQKLLPLDIEKLPPSWEELTDTQKSHVTEVLNKNIEQSVRVLLAATGL